MNAIPFLPSPLINGPALSDDLGEALDYSALAARASQWSVELAQDKSLVFCYIRNTCESVAAFLGALGAGHGVALLAPELPKASRIALEDQYSPDIIIEGAQVTRCVAPAAPLNPDLSLLLSTSGSTGGAKLVRLTLDNMISNATAIAQALDIRGDDVAAAHLPLHYSYGLSVLTSHLMQGAKIVLTERSFVDRLFWETMRAAKVTHFPGVPFHYDMMLRLGFERLGLDSLRVITQAGGNLPLAAREKAHAFMEAKGGRFYVMYGQTEAAPRITTLPHEDFPHNSGTVGRTLQGGRLFILDEEGVAVPQGEEGIVWYEGPNVMMGYADKRADLARGDDQHGKLATGDVGWLDADGRLTITGRVKRFGKVYGLRVNLDEIEQLAKTVWTRTAVVQTGDKVQVFLASTTGSAPVDDIKAVFAKHYTLPPTAYSFRLIDEIPFTDRGKTNYRTLEGFV